MLLVKRTTGLAWLAMLACLVVLLVSTGASSSYAQTSGSPTKSSGTLEDGDGTNTGDPDMPTGDTPPPSSTSGNPSGNDGGLNRGHTMTGGITEVVPDRRHGQWAFWKHALKLFARSFIVR